MQQQKLNYWQNLRYRQSICKVFVNFVKKNFKMPLSEAQKAIILEEISNLKLIHQVYLKNEALGGVNRVEHILDIMIRITELQKIIDEDEI
jgi:glutaredoxin-related protein